MRGKRPHGLFTPVFTQKNWQFLFRPSDVFKQSELSLSAGLDNAVRILFLLI